MGIILATKIEAGLSYESTRPCFIFEYSIFILFFIRVHTLYSKFLGQMIRLAVGDHLDF